MANYFVYNEFCTQTGLDMRQLVAKNLDLQQAEEVRNQAEEQLNDIVLPGARVTRIADASKAADRAILQELEHFKVYFV